MPANLTPQYHEAEAKYRAAVTSQEKLDALEEMLAVIPKHKGTEHMRADIKRRISKIKERDKKLGVAKRGYEFRVEREGAGQIALVGPPNSGKSLLLDRFTAAEPKVADYPFSTRKPMPGMMEFEDIQIQLVDMPPITPGTSEPWLLAIVRSADAALIVLDSSSPELLEDLEGAREELATGKILLRGPEQEPPKDLGPSLVTRPAIIAANKSDLDGADENLSTLRDLYGAEMPVVPISAQTGEGLEELKRSLFDLLGIIRVYTKVPGKPPDIQRPFTLPRGSTLLDLAIQVHHDFAQRFKFARAWGKGKPDGVMIGRDYVFEDKDIVELHA